MITWTPVEQPGCTNMPADTTEVIVWFEGFPARAWRFNDELYQLTESNRQLDYPQVTHFSLINGPE